MDENFKKQLYLMAIDKIFFGIVVALISIGFSYYIQVKISETDRLKQVLQSASNLNSDLVKLLRSHITKSMESYITGVNNFKTLGEISEEDLDKLFKNISDIGNSIKLIDILHEDFSKGESVKSFRKEITNLCLNLDPKKKYKSYEIEKKLNEVKKTYIKALIEIGNVSIQLAEKDYENVAKYLSKRKLSGTTSNHNFN